MTHVSARWLTILPKYCYNTRYDSHWCVPQEMVYMNTLGQRKCAANVVWIIATYPAERSHPATSPDRATAVGVAGLRERRDGCPAQGWKG